MVSPLQEEQVGNRLHSRQGGYHVQYSHDRPWPEPLASHTQPGCSARQSEPPDSPHRPQTPQANGVQGPCRPPQTRAHPPGRPCTGSLPLRLPRWRLYRSHLPSLPGARPGHHSDHRQSHRLRPVAYLGRWLPAIPPAITKSSASVAGPPGGLPSVWPPGSSTISSLMTPSLLPAMTPSMNTLARRSSARAATETLSALPIRSRLSAGGTSGWSCAYSSASPSRADCGRCPCWWPCITPRLTTSRPVVNTRHHSGCCNNFAPSCYTGFRTATLCSLAMATTIRTSRPASPRSGAAD
jgi:hypothetical protein